MFKLLLQNFIKANGRSPNAIEMLQLKFKAASQANRGQILPFKQKRDFAAEIKAMMDDGTIKVGQVDKKNDNVLQRELFKNSNLNNPEPVTIKSGVSNSQLNKNKAIDQGIKVEPVNEKFIQFTIQDIKKKEPIEGMKIANQIIKREGDFVDLTEEQSKKILTEVNDHIMGVDLPIGPEDLAKGGRAGFQQGGLPSVDPRMNLDYDTLVEQNVDKRLQDPTFLNNIKGVKAPEGTLGPITTMPVGPDPDIPVEELIDGPYYTGKDYGPGNQPYTAVMPQEGMRYVYDEQGTRYSVPNTQPTSLEDYLSGYEQYKSNNPNTYMGTQALIDATLPGGIDYTFNSGAHANHFNDYLRSIGLSPYQKNLTTTMIEKFNQGGRAGFYTGGITDVEPSLDDIGHGSDSLMARTRLMSPGSQATTSTGLNYLLAEDNDNIRVPFAKGKIAKEVLDKGRRGFMKAAGAAGAGIAALKTGLLGFGEKAAPVVEKAVESAKGVPPYFFKLVDKIKSFGEDVTEKAATLDRQKVTKYKDFELTEDVATGEMTIQRMKVLDDGSESYYGKPLTEETYMNYKPGKGQVDESTKGIPPDEYEQGTALLRSDREYAGEVVDESFEISDDVLKEVGETITKKADGGRIGFSKGKLAINAGRKFLEKVFGKEKLKNIVDNDPELEQGMLEVVEMFRNKDKEGLKMYLQKYLPHMDDAEIEDFIVSSGDSAGIEGQLIRLGSGRDYAGKLDMMKQADEIRKLENFDVEGVSKNAEGGRIGLFLGGGLKAGKGLLRNMLNFMAEKSTHGKKGSEMLQLVNPKQLDKYLNDPATMGKVSPEAPAGIPEIINAKKKEMTEDRSTMVGDLIGTARRIKKVDDDIMNYKKTITNEMIGRGIDPETAAEMAENLAEMVAKDAGKKASPNITDQGLLELENIQKNLLTKDRKLQAQGGLTTMLGE